MHSTFTFASATQGIPGQIFQHCFNFTESLITSNVCLVLLQACRWEQMETDNSMAMRELAGRLWLQEPTAHRMCVWEDFVLNALITENFADNHRRPECPFLAASINLGLRKCLLLRRHKCDMEQSMKRYHRKDRHSYPHFHIEFPQHQWGDWIALQPGDQCCHRTVSTRAWGN